MRRAVNLALISVALVAVTVAAFHAVTSFGFVHYDDDGYVSENPHVQEGLRAESIAWAFTTTAQANWHPLTWLSHMLDVQLFGLDAGKHHGTSLLLHAANAVLLFLLLVRMTGALWPSAFAAALFAIHPLHVESVAWIAERKDVLSTLFWLLTIAAWLRFLESRTRARYALALVLYLLGLLSKPMLVTLPFTLLLLDFWPLRRLGLPLRESRGALRGLLTEKAPLFAMAAASCVATFAVQRSAGAVQTFEDLAFAGRLANAIVSYAAYLGKAAWPTSLAFFYPLPHVALFSWSVAGSIVLLTGATALALRLRRRAPFFVFGWLWYLGTLVPVIGLIQVGGQARADRYTYVPLIGIFVAVAWGLAEIGKGHRAIRYAVAPVAAAALVALFAATRGQVRTWADDVPLFEHALAVTSDNWMAHGNFGLTLFDRGRLDEAIAHDEESLRIRPRYKRALANLALALATKGDDAGAIERYAQVLEVDPKDPIIHFQLARALARVGRVDDAIAHYTEALRLRPAYPEAEGNLGSLLAERGRTDDAIAHYEESLRLRPDNPVARYNLGNALLAKDRLAEAVAQLTEAIRLRPDFAEAHNSLGVAFLRQGRIPDAVSRFDEALRLRPDLEGARKNLQSAGAR